MAQVRARPSREYAKLNSPRLPFASIISASHKLTNLEEDSAANRRKHFLDVEWFRKVHLENLKRRGRLSRVFGRVSWAVDSMQGIFVGMLFVVIVFGTIGMVAFSFYVSPLVGPFGFVALFGAVIGGLAFLADRKVGRSLQFGDRGFLRSTAAQVAGMAIAVGFMLFLVIGLPWLLTFRLF